MIKYILLILVLFTSNISAQKTIVNYEAIKPPIFPVQTEPIKLGILEFKTYQTNPDLTEKFYNSLKSDTSILRKFEIYPAKVLIQLSHSLKIDFLNPDDIDVLKKLYDALGIKYIVSGESTEAGLIIFLRNTISGDLIFSNIYKDSDSSSALSDAVRIFSKGLTTKYILRGMLNVIIQPPEAEFFIDTKEQESKTNIYLDPGKYILDFISEGYYPLRKSIEIEEGKNLYLTFSMEPSFGKLKLDVSPSETKVRMIRVKDTNNVREWIGSTFWDHIQTGMYNIILSSLGFKQVERSLTIWADTLREEKISLIRMFYVIESIFSNEFTAYGLRIEAGEDQYKIHFNLIGEPDDDYEISLYLVNSENPDKLVELKGLHGDLGDKIYSGPDKVIFWDVKKDFPNNVDHNGYRFYLEVD